MCFLLPFVGANLDPNTGSERSFIDSNSTDGVSLFEILECQTLGDDNNPQQVQDTDRRSPNYMKSKGQLSYYTTKETEKKLVNIVEPGNFPDFESLDKKTGLLVYNTEVICIYIYCPSARYKYHLCTDTS